MRRCIKKGIRILVRNHLVKSRIALLGIASFVLQMTYSQESPDFLVPATIPLSPRFDEEESNQMIKIFVEKGVCDLYNDCSDFSTKEKEVFLYYAILMADKYGCEDAYYDVYWNIIEMSEKNKFEISENLWNFAFYYLNKAAEMEDWNALVEMKILYRDGNKYIQPNKEKSKFYEEKIHEQRMRNK